MKRIGLWKLTYTGRQFWTFDPRPEDFDLQDIAHALAMTCRFGGHCRVPYSVAEHSVRVANQAARLCADRGRRQWVAALVGLLHDAAEAYVGDMPAPIKRSDGMTFYRLTEDLIMGQIWKWIGLDSNQVSDVESAVRFADLQLLATEARDLMPRSPCWEDLPPALAGKISPLGWQEAKAEWLRTFALVSDRVKHA